MSKLKIVYKHVDEIIPYVNNPRKISQNAIDKVASSIKNFGFKVPIIIDKDNEIVAGHNRILAAKKLGMEEVPCIVVEDLTEQQIKAFRIADNKTSEFAEWDMELLEIELEGLDDIFTGFDNDEIEKILSLGFDYSADQFGTEFELPDGGRNPIRQMSFTLHEEQVKLIEYALDIVKRNVGANEIETFGNTNMNGNLLYMVVKEWAELKK